MQAWPWKERQLDLWDIGLLVIVGGVGVWETIRAILKERKEKK